MTGFARANARRCVDFVPLIIGVATLWSGLCAILRALDARMPGAFGYPLDDTYIHMAMARSLAFHGVWGVTPHAFAPASSSPLWVLMLAGAYRVFGLRDTLPFVLNAAFATALVALVVIVLRRRGAGPIVASATGIAIVLVAPTLAVAWTGMEHVLHAVLFLAFLLVLGRALADQSERRRGFSHADYGLLALAVVLVAIRYEGMFAIAVATGLLAYRRRFGLAAAVAIAGTLPIAVMGAVSVANGWYAIPSSVLAKSDIGGGATKRAMFLVFGGRFAVNVIRASNLVVILAAVLILLRLQETDPRVRRSVPYHAAVALLLTAAIHFAFAKVGYFFRYEAYLITAGIAVTGMLVASFLAADRGRKERAVLVAVLGCAAVVLAHVTLSHAADPGYLAQASRNIREQQYQMARFIRAYYRNEGVALNDIGAVCYLASPRLTDLAGLGSREVLRARIVEGASYPRTGPTFFRDLCRANGVRIAILYDHWFAGYGGLPREWTRVGEWEIRDNVVCGGTIVALYATSPAEADRLARNLRAFAGRLPPTVRQTGLYTATHPAGIPAR